MKLSKRVKKYVGTLVLFSQVFSLLAPLSAFAAPINASGSDTKNALETVGTKANRLKTVGTSGVDESSGAFTYSYPLTTPRGKFGLEPNLSINYNSQTAENSIVGYGMTFTVPYIERTSKEGSDKMYTSTNSFVSSLGGELVLVPNSTTNYIQKFDDGSYQTYIFSSNIWTLTDRNGYKYTYGTDTTSRLSDSTGVKIARWYLVKVTDLMGNKITYTYEKKNGYVYPKEIWYTQDKNGNFSNKIVFEREIRSDAETSYKYGFLINQDDRIKSVKAYTDNILVGQFDLSYTLGNNGKRSLLSSITESRSGTDGVTTTIPTTTFTYQNDITISKSANINVQAGQGFQDITGDGRPEYFATTGSLAPWKVIDYNGDYMPDMYYSIPAQTSCSGYCFMQPASGSLKYNSGNGVFSTLPISTTNFPFTALYNIFSIVVDSGVFITDINADGFSDVIGTTAKLNTGVNFIDSTFNNPSADQILDVNGDGLPDVIKGTQVFLNNGTNWNTASDTKYIVPFSATLPADKNGQIYDAGVRFVDINTDGLVDVIRSYTFNTANNCNYYSNYCSTSVNDVHINTGVGWVANSNFSLTNFVMNYSATNNMNSVPWTISQNDFSEINTDGSVNGIKQDVLKKVKSPLGSTVDITYKNSVAGTLNSDLPFNVLVVDKINETEVKTGLIETTSYIFEGGKMYADISNNGANIRDRRYSGFKKVTIQKGNSKMIKYFHQGDSDDGSLYERGDSAYLIGKVFKEESYGTSNNFKYSDLYRNYGVYNYNGQIFSYLKQEVNTNYDSNGGILAKAVVYEYDLAARLPKQVTNYGKVTYDIVTNTITDQEGDTVITKNIVSTTRPQKVISEETFDVNGKFLDKKMYFYDGLPFGYIEKGFLTESRNYSNTNNYIKTNYTYNSLGLKQSEIDNNGNTTSYTYDAYANPTTVTNTLGQITNVTYDKVTGLQTYSKSPNGTETSTIYDGFGNAKSVSKTNPVNGTLTLAQTESRTYNSNGINVTTNIYSNGSILKDTVTTIDSFGRVVKILEKTDANGSVGYKATDYVYNNLGQLVSISYPYSNIFVSLGSGMQSVFSYDDVGRVIKQKLGDNESSIVYFVNGKKIYDNTAQTHSKTFLYNSFDKLVSVTETNNGADQITKYTWNILGNLTNITDAEGNTRNFTYDTEGRLLTQEDLHKPSDNTYGVYKYTYDSIGNLISKKDPSGNITTFTYDNLYRPVSEVGTDFNNVYIYDTCTNGAGALCSVSTKDYLENLSYKVGGIIQTNSKTIYDETGNKTFAENYEYNDLGQVTKVTLPDSSTLNYSYNLIGKQKSVALTRTISGVASTTTFVSDSEYNVDGTQQYLTYGNGAKTCYRYSTTNGGNVAPRLSGIYAFKNNQDCNNLGNYASSTNLLYAEDLSYNLFGQIIQMKERFVGDTGNITANFQYDDLQRLISTSRVDANINSNLTVTRTQSYSAIGNLLSSDSTKYVYSGSDYANPNAPTLIGTTRMSYDLNGNVLGDGNNLYEWNSKNRMKKSDNTKSSSEYTYDVSGERIKEKVTAKNVDVDPNANLVAFTDTTYFADDIPTGTSTTKMYISQTAYNEINAKLNPANATLTSQFVTEIVAPIYTSSFVTNTCKTVLLNDKSTCERETTMKALYVKLKKEKSQTISFGTLSEMWLVFKGQLAVSADVYAPKKFEKVLDFVDPTLKLYFTQQNSFSDYTGQPYCTVMESAGNNYVCNLIFPNTFIPKYDGFSVQKSEFSFSSPYVISATTTKISSLLNINLASTSKYATTSNSNFSWLKASGTSAGYYRYKADLTNIATAWSNSESTNIGLSIRNEPATTSNQSYYFMTPYSPWSIDIKPKITVDYNFTGTLNTFNPATTTVIAAIDVDNYYNSVIAGIATQNATTIITTNISEASYVELANVNLNSKGKIEVLFAVAFNSDYVMKTCFGSTDVNCLKKEGIKYVASLLQQKYNIKLSAITLEEIYQVYIGKLILPVSNFPYQKTVKGSYIINSAETAVEGCKIFFQYYDQYPQDYNASWVKTYINTCTDNFYYNTNIWKNSNLSAYISFDINSTDGRKILPLSVSIRDGSVSGGYTQVTNATTSIGAYKFDITSAFTAQKNWSNKGANNMSAWNQIIFTTTDTSDLSKKAQINNVRVTFAEYENKNSINSGVVPLVTQAVIDGEVTAKSNIPLLGAIYKEKAIPSLFSTAKYISQETFNELSTLGIGYSKLIIYDRLVDTSFGVYPVCDSISSSDMKDNCKKAIFVKYLYSIVKYETDKELSTYALDEAYEVVNGNLRIPNDITEYRITEVKSYTVNGGNPINSMIVYTGGSGYTYNSGTQYANSGCTFSNYVSGGLTAYHMCSTQLPLPQEVIDRKGEITKAELGLNFSQGLQSSSGTLVPYTAPTLTIYPLVANATYSYSQSQPQPGDMYGFNANINYGTSTATNISLPNTNYVDIVKMVKGFTNGEINNFGIRFIGNNQMNQTNVTNTGAYELRVTYIRDAQQNSRSYFTPLILDPKDATVYANVLSVLARIDKNYVGGLNISKNTYNEIKLTDLATSTDLVKLLFQNNMQLQKDNTLAAVWNDFRINKNTFLTREALEELWMVFNDSLSMATDSSIYASTTYPFFDRTKLTNLSVVPGVISTRELVDDYSFSKLFRVSTDTSLELSNASITRKIDIIPFVTNRPFTASSTITQVEKNETQVNIYANVLTNKNIKLSREALEELYYVWNDKEIFALDDTATNTEKFDRMKFGTLEQLHYADTIIGSKVEQKLDDNITYTPAATTPVFIISDETRGELGLGGITTQGVLDTIWNSASSTSLTTKDAKLYNLYSKVKTNTNFELSREALEEVYLIQTGKVFWNTSTSTNAQVVSTGNISTNYLKTKGSYDGNLGRWVYTTSTTTNACNEVGTTADYSTWPTSYPVLTCTSTITVNNIPGYYITSAQLIIPGQLSYPGSSYITLSMLFDGVQIGPSAAKDITNHVLATSTHTLVLNTNSGYINYLLSPGMPSVKVIYSPYTTKFQRSNLSELNITSSISDLSNAYQLAIGATTTAITQDNFIPLSATSSTSTNQLLTSGVATNTVATVTPTIVYQTITNPYGYPYSDNSDGTYTFYLPNGATSSDPLTRVYNSIAKNLNINSTSTLSYTKFYPFNDYEYDTRGVVTINIPFNGKVVGTYKYDTNTNSTIPAEISYIHNSYNATPVVITNSTGSTTEVIKRDVWGSMINNNYNENDVIPTSFGLTGHKADEHSKLTYAHARYLSNVNKVWLSHDPFSIENFTNSAWLQSPQIQNSYSYTSNNPINMIDPDGKKPTYEEAQLMAQDVYSNTPGNNLSGGWKLDSVITSGDHMMMGQYSRAVNGKTEYTLSFKGTDGSDSPYFKSDWKNNFQQPFGWSDDANSAVDLATKFGFEHNGADITTTGHSKGGAEAILAGVYNNWDAIVFNPARASFSGNNMLSSWRNYSGTIDIYRVQGEVLTSIFGTNYGPQVNVHTLTSQNYYNPIAPNNMGLSTYGTSVSVSSSFMSNVKNSVVNHFMGNVILGKIK